MLASIAVYGDRFAGETDVSLSLTMTRSARRGPWLPEEDEALLQLVRSQGANNWVRISQQLQHRSPKQCRERYHQNLKPSLKHDPISAQEGEVIERLVQEMGKRWAEIARRLGNRSDNAVKNWWNGSVNRRRRNPAQTTTGFKQVGNRLQPIPFTLPSEQNYTQYPRPTTSIDIGANTTSFDAQHDHLRSSKPITSHSSGSASVSEDTKSWQSWSTSKVISSISRPSITRVQALNQRPELPPLRSSYHYPYNERLGSAMERPPISPALSDTSQRHTPSLVSDNQSMYSISPRAVTTPRPGLPAPSEATSSTWSDTHTMTQRNYPQNQVKSIYQVEPFQKAANHLPLDPALQRCPVSAHIDERSKDSRMHVSTLLQ